ncbi:MAG: hypothetical protein WCG19_09030 [Chlorobiaceae bacterium]
MKAVNPSAKLWTRIKKILASPATLTDNRKKEPMPLSDCLETFRNETVGKRRK